MQELKDPIINALKKLNKQKIQVLNEIIDKRNENTKKMKISYIQDIMKDELQFSMSDFQNKLECSIKEFRQTQKPKIKPNFTTYMFKVGNNVNIPSRPTSLKKEKVPDINNKIDFKKSSYYDFLSLNTSNSLNQKISNNNLNQKNSSNLLNLLNNSTDNQSCKINTEDLNQSKDNETNETNQTNQTNNSFSKNTQTEGFVPSHKKNDNIKITDITRPISNILSGNKYGKHKLKSSFDVNSTYEINKSIIRQTSTATITLIDNSYEKESYIPQSVKSNFIKIRYGNKIKKSKSMQKGLLIKNLTAKNSKEKSVQSWRDYKKIHYFNSGVFNIPLFAPK